MGQRLNIEIIKGGKTLANAYYHWGAYTASALELTEIVLRNVDKVNASNDVLYAVRLLETTGTLLKENEISEMKKITPDEEFAPAQSRNSGLIAVSEKEMDFTRLWEEGRVEIDLDQELIRFDVYWYLEKEDFDSVAEYESIPLAEREDYMNVPFDEFKAFAEEIYRLIEKGVYQIRLKNGNVIEFIDC